MKRITIRSARNQEGSALIEFAVIAPVFFLMMMGIIEFGMYMLTQIAIEGAVSQAGRSSAVLAGGGTGSEELKTKVEALIRQKTGGLPNADKIVISARVVSAGPTSPPDLCMATGAPVASASCPGGAAFIDNNSNGVYDGPGGVSLGSPGDIVEIRVSYPWQVMFPLFNQLIVSQDQNGNSVSGVSMITSTTVIKNE